MPRMGETAEYHIIVPGMESMHSESCRFRGFTAAKTCYAQVGTQLITVRTLEKTFRVGRTWLHW
jgi:hypothetical protein